MVLVMAAAQSHWHRFPRPEPPGSALPASLPLTQPAPVFSHCGERSFVGADGSEENGFSPSFDEWSTRECAPHVPLKATAKLLPAL